MSNELHVLKNMFSSTNEAKIVQFGISRGFDVRETETGTDCLAEFVWIISLKAFKR